MATSLLAKLIRNQCRHRSITQKISVTSIHNPLFSVQTPQTSQFGETKIENPISLDPSLQFGIYPSFSFQHFLNPLAPFSPDFSVLSEAEDLNTIWADSVKKKRKKKMNKHKLKKLRKRLRRKTKK